jgi:hypothetical protein
MLLSLDEIIKNGVYPPIGILHNQISKTCSTINDVYDHQWGKVIVQDELP